MSNFQNYRSTRPTFSGEAVFRSPSGAVFTYKSGPLSGYKWDREFWGNLPVSSVRRVTVVLINPSLSDEDEWLVDMLGDPDFLEVLELGGDCGRVLQRLRHRLVQGVMRTDIKTLIVRGGEYAKSQALELESVKDDVGLEDMTVTYIPDPGAHEGCAPDSDDDSSSADENWSQYSEESTDSDYEDTDDDDE
jgi:hypothetical protein